MNTEKNLKKRRAPRISLNRLPPPGYEIPAPNAGCLEDPTDVIAQRVPPPTESFWKVISRKLPSYAVWGCFFGLLFLFRSFLALIFITFILSYAINSLQEKLSTKIPWPRWSIVVVIYFLLGILLAGIGMTIFPKVYQESKNISREIPEAKDNLVKHFKGFLQADPDFSKFMEGVNFDDNIREWITPMVSWITSFLQVIFRTSFHLLLSLIFSFLIIWDLERLKTDIQGLKYTRLAPVYDLMAPMLIQFGSVVGMAFEAQIMIAMVNTLLTLCGLTYLGIPSPLFLSVLVFFFSFIPVVGMIMSSLPICLLGFKTGGLILAFYSALMIAIIHVIEAYILNPRIVGSHFSLHPFLAVCILVISETWFGVWGLLLGVPIAVFFYRSFVLPLPPLEDAEKNVPSSKNVLPES